MRMRSFFVTLSAVCLLGRAVLAQSADPMAELHSFSVFDKLSLDQIAAADVKTAHGPPSSTGRFLSVQSVYVVPGSPAQHLAALRAWKPTQHRELKIFMHEDFSSPSESAFAAIKNAPENSPVRTFVNNTAKMSNDIQVSREEAGKFKGGADAKLNGAVGDFWMSVLSARAKAFLSGGTSALPPYDHAGPVIRAGDELNGLLREQGKIRKQFASFLDGTGIGRGAGSRPDSYWELQEVDDTAAATLGAFYSKSGGGGAQAAEVTYYSSGGYYAGLTLYQMWPVTANGKASTLVWRGDMVSSATLSSLRGVEKLGSESAMMKNIGRVVTLFRKDSVR